jgi:hypothetical protein
VEMACRLEGVLTVTPLRHCLCHRQSQPLRRSCTRVAPRVIEDVLNRSGARVVDCQRDVFREREATHARRQLG